MLNEENKSFLTVGIYLKKEEIDAMSTVDLKILMQLSRIINNIMFRMRLKILLKTDHNKLFDFRNQVEVLFELVSSIREGVKTFFRDIDPKLDPKYIPQDIHDSYEKIKRRVEDRDNDSFYKVADYIRNYISFHFSEEIYKDIIKETGKTEKDILLGVAVGPAVGEFLLTEPYTSMFMKISEIIPCNIRKDKFYDWLNESAIKEARQLCSIFNKILRAMIKGRSIKKEIEEEYVLDWKNN